MNIGALSMKMSIAGCEKGFVFLAVLSLQPGKEHNSYGSSFMAKLTEVCVD